MPGKVGGGGSPDYMALANQQGQQQQAYLGQQTAANRPNIVNPYGSSTWQQVQVPGGTIQNPFGGGTINLPGTTSWQQTQTLNPQLQDVLSQRLGLASGIAGRLGSEMQPLDTSQLTPYARPPTADNATFNQAQGAAYQNAQSFLDPQWQQAEQTKRSQLYAMGAKEGDPVFDQEMGNFQRSKDQAYQQAYNQAFQTGLGAMGTEGNLALQSAGLGDTQRAQQISEQLQQSGWSLNQINQLLTGMGISPPGNASPNPTAGMGQAPDYLNAASANANQSNQAFGNIASTAASLIPLMMMSDEEQKDFTGEDAGSALDEFLEASRGLGFDYKDAALPGAGHGHYVTPTAQNLEQSELGRDLVTHTPDGRVVDYGKAFGTFAAALAHVNDKVEEFKAFGF